MYKELIICLIIIILIICLNIITEKNTKNTIENMDEMLGKLEESMQDGNKEKIDILIEEVLENWKERKNVLEYYIEHDELEKVETELYELKAKVKTKNYDEGLANIEKGIFILNHIKEKYKLKIQNIF